MGQVSESLNNYLAGFVCSETEQVSTLPLVPCPPVRLGGFETFSGVLSL